MNGPPVMLASPAPGSPTEAVVNALQEQGTWWFEAKFDGVRAVLSRTSRGGIQITNRRQVDITYRYPDVEERFEGIDFVGVLDGEIICVDAAGRPAFERAHRRDAQATAAAARRLSLTLPATFVPFDVLEVGGKDVRPEPYTARRMRLGTMLAGEKDVWSISSQDGAAMWSVVTSWNLEGLVAKLGTSSYTPGRSQHWLKLKSTKRISALVSGYTPGKGSRGAVGALTLVLYDTQAQALVPIGKVGSGLSAQDLRTAAQQLEAKVPTVVDVEYLEVSASGQLRMPVFKGFRQDVPIEECTIDTLL